MANQKKKTLPPQHQNRQPGFEYVMDPRPVFDKPKAAKNLKENGGHHGRRQRDRPRRIRFIREGRR